MRKGQATTRQSNPQRPNAESRLPQEAATIKGETMIPTICAGSHLQVASSRSAAEFVGAKFAANQRPRPHGNSEFHKNAGKKNEGVEVSNLYFKKLKVEHTGKEK